MGVVWWMSQEEHASSGITSQGGTMHFQQVTSVAVTGCTFSHSTAQVQTHLHTCVEACHEWHAMHAMQAMHAMHVHVVQTRTTHARAHTHTHAPIQNTIEDAKHTTQLSAYVHAQGGSSGIGWNAALLFGNQRDSDRLLIYSE